MLKETKIWTEYGDGEVVAEPVLLIGHTEHDGVRGWHYWQQSILNLTLLHFTTWHFAAWHFTTWNCQTVRIKTWYFTTWNFKTCHFKTCHFKTCHFKTCHYKIWHYKKHAFNRTLYKNNFSDVIWQLVFFSNMFVHVLIYLHNVCKSMFKRVLLRTWYRQLCCQVLIKRNCIRYLDRHWKLDCIA